MAKAQSKRQREEAKRKDLLHHICNCLNEARGALAWYELCVLDATEHLLWVAGFDTTIRLWRDKNRLIVGLFASEQQKKKAKAKGSLTLADLFNAFLDIKGPPGTLWLSFESDVVLSDKEVNRVKKLLGLSGKTQ